MKKTCPQAIRMCIDQFKTLTGRQVRNSLSIDPLLAQDDVDMLQVEGFDAEFTMEDYPPLEEPLPTDIWTAFASTFPREARIGKATMINRITHQGIFYTARRIHEGNSGIFLKDSFVPACIEGFIETSSPTKCNIWVVVRRHRLLKVEIDPYLNYPLLKARLWAPDLELKYEIFPVSHIDTHFAKCAVSWEGQAAAVIISLSHMT